MEYKHQRAANIVEKKRYWDQAEMDGAFLFNVWADVPIQIFPVQKGGTDCGIWPISYINVLFSLADPCQAQCWVEAKNRFPSMDDIPELRATYALQFQCHKAVERKQLFGMKGNRAQRDQKLQHFLKTCNIQVGSITGGGDCFIQSILAGVRQCYQERGISRDFPVTSGSLRKAVVDELTEALKNQ